MKLFEKTLLIDLLKHSKLEVNYSNLSQKNIFISNICVDSRKTQPGDFFIAIPCLQVIHNIEDAIQKGAVAVLSTPEVIRTFANSVTFIEYDNPQLALSLLAKTFFKNQPKILMAVTGTNGKSSVVSIVRQLWGLLGFSAASFGTVGLETTNNIKNLPPTPALTTYDSLSYFHLLQSLVQAGVNHAVFEASSIGLDQCRVHGSEITVAAFTNFTQDHLDYHQTMEDYFLAKEKLFSEILAPGKSAVLNANSPYLEQLKAITSQRGIHTFTYAINASADLCASNIKIQSSNIIFDLEHNNQTYHNVVLNLSGAFQIENTLCAIGMLIASGVEITEIITNIPKLKPIVGRMEMIGETPRGGYVYIDYAHTPDALDRALHSIRTYTKNAVWVVFGCGGERDNLKRSLMGKIALNLADKIIVTDDNPRSENPSFIRQQILSECISKAHEIADRREAIAYAIAHLEKGDTLLIAGKGHETGQTIGNQTYPFSDKEEAEYALTRLKS